jgi:hypothetical protein
MSFTVSSTVFPVASNSQTLPCWVCRASIRQVSRISAERFSQSLASLKPRFCMNCFSSLGFLRKMKTWVVRSGGVTALA